jgi:hypothetical protein
MFGICEEELTAKEKEKMQGLQYYAGCCIIMQALSEP